MLAKRFVFKPVDKAFNNVAVVLREYYTEVRNNELINSLKFKIMRFTEIQRVNINHVTSTSQFKAFSEYLKVPTMQWLLILHSNTLKYRFVSAFRKCSTTIPYQYNFLFFLYKKYSQEHSFFFNITIT